MKRYLFICVENSCRSQMAEAFARMAGVEAFSAGSKASGVVNPKAIVSMREVGYDLSTHKSETIDSLPEGEFEVVVSMGCGDACPFVPAKRRVEWEIPDPKHMEPEEFAVVRDRIRDEVHALLAEARRIPPEP